MADRFSPGLRRTLPSRSRRPADRRVSHSSAALERRPATTGGLVLLVALGDTHGDFAPLFEACRREPAARALLQVGDLTAGKAGREQHTDDDPATLDSLPLPLVWVHGNHEHWDVLGLVERETAPRGIRTVAEMPGSPSATQSTPAAPPASLPRSVGTQRARYRFLEHHLWPGECYIVPETQVRIAGLPGNYAPTWFEREKPFPGERVRHFNRWDVEALRRIEQPSVLLMHEAFRGQAPGRIGGMGIPVLADLVQHIRPDLCLTGHHHTLAVTQRGTTRAISLPRAQGGYMRLWFHPEGRLQGWQFVPFQAEGAVAVDNAADE